jgi:hypothetical protein
VYGGFSREVDYHGISRRLTHGISRTKGTVSKKEGSDRVLNPVELARHQVLNCSRGNRLEWDSNLLGLKVRRMLLIDKPNTTHTYLARGRFRLSLWARAMGASTKRRPSPRALNISAECNGPPVFPVDWFEAPVHQPLLGFLEHVGRVLLGFFLVLGIFVTFVTAAYTFVQDSGASGYEVTGWAVICAPLVFPLQIVKAFLRVQAKVQRVLNQVSSFCRSSHVIKIIVAVLYTLLYVVFIASLLLFGV